MPILNGEEFLERVLGALQTQKIGIPWDFLAVDCGSTDRTLAIFEEYAERFPVPLRVHQIHQSEFNHGDTRNLLVALTSGELAVFLTDDSIPIGEDYLARIAANFEDERIAACHVRNLPRPEVSDLLKVTSARDPNYQAGRKLTLLETPLYPENWDGAARRSLYNYNDVASAVRRSIWERYPYPHCDFGEDVLLGRAALEAGYAVLYEDAVCVQHSHEYDCEQLFERGRQDALFNAEHLNYRCVEQEADIAALVERKLQLDRSDLSALGLFPPFLEEELDRSRKESTAFFAGMHAGSHSRRRYRGTGLNADSHPTIEAWGLPDDILQALQRRGWSFLPPDQGADVLHVHGEPPEGITRLRARRRSGQPTLWTVNDEWARRNRMRKAVLDASECDDRAKLGHAPDSLKFEPSPTVDPFQVFVLRQEQELDQLRGSERQCVHAAAEETLRTLEVRYRSLASHLQDPRGHCPMDWRGDEAIAVEGLAEQVSRGSLLLRAGASASWDIRGLPPGTYHFLVSAETLASEPGVVSGGQVLIDERPCGSIGPFLGSGLEERRHLRLPIEIMAGDQRVRIHASDSQGNGTLLRVQRVRLLQSAPSYGRRSVEECSLDGRGLDGTGRGNTASEGCDMLRLGPGAATGEWPVSDLTAGPYRLRLWLAYAESEAWLQQRGHVRLDGRTIAHFQVPAPPGQGGFCELEATVRVPEGARVLSVQHRPSLWISKHFVRVHRIQLVPIPLPTCAGSKQQEVSPSRLHPWHSLLRRHVPTMQITQQWAPSESEKV